MIVHCPPPRRRFSLIAAAILAVLLGAMPNLATASPSDAHASSLAPPVRSGHAVTTVRIYLVAIGDQGRTGTKIGCGDSLVPVQRPVPATSAPLAVAMTELLRDHHRYFGQSGLYNALYQSRLRVKRVRLATGAAKIYLTGTMRLGGECDNPRVGAQLRHTALQFSSVRHVGIFIDNVPLWKRLSLR